MFSITKFKSNLRVVRPNLFFAEVDLPSTFASSIRSRLTNNLSGSVIINGAPTPWFDSLGPSPLNTTFRMRCEATELPGRTVATSDDMSYGPTIRHAYDTTYSDLVLQIIASDDMRERAFFEIWIENIINSTNLRGGVKGRGGLSKYYDEYANGQVRIYQMNELGVQLARYTLYGAYPVQISPMNLTWEEQNTYQRFSVTMTYRFHVVDFNKVKINIT